MKNESSGGNVLSEIKYSIYVKIVSMSVAKTPEISYMIGALQGDGCLTKYFVKEREDRITLRHVIILEAIDLEMVKKVKEIFERTFSRKRKIYKRSEGRFGFTFGVKTLLNEFKELDIDFKDPPKPPQWIKNRIDFFGPYLAGLIDADGDVRIKRPKYPQCAIRITSGHPQKYLKEFVEKNLNCCASITEEKSFNKQWIMWNHGFSLEFLVSSKNFDNIKQYILQYIQRPRKKLIIERYLRKFDIGNTAKVAESGHAVWKNPSIMACRY